MENTDKYKVASAYVQILDDVINSDCFRGLIAASVELSQVNAFGAQWEEHFKEKYTRLCNVLKKYRSQNSYGISLAEYKGFGTIDMTSLFSFIMDANDESLSAREAEPEEGQASRRIRKCNEEFSQLFLKHANIDERAFYSALMDLKECRNIVSHRNNADYKRLSENPNLMRRQSNSIKLFVDVVKNRAGDYGPIKRYLREIYKKDVVTETSIATKIENLVDISNDRYCFYDDIKKGLYNAGKNVDIVAVLKGQPYLTVSNDLIIGSTYPLLMAFLCDYEHLYKPEEKDAHINENKQVVAPRHSGLAKLLIALICVIAAVLVMVLISEQNERNKIEAVNAAVTYETKAENPAVTYETKAENPAKDSLVLKESENITSREPEASQNYDTESNRDCVISGENWSNTVLASPEKSSDAFADYYVKDIYDYISMEIAPYSDNFNKDASVIVRILDADSEDILAESEAICKSSKKQSLCADIKGHKNVRILLRKFGDGRANTLINNIYLNQHLPEEYKESFVKNTVSCDVRRNITFDMPEVMENFTQTTVSKNKNSINCEPAFVSEIQFGSSGYMDFYIANQYDTISLSFAPDRNRIFSDKANCTISLINPLTDEVIAKSEAVTYDSKETTLSGSVTGLEYIRITADSEGSGWAETYIKDIIVEKK